LKARDQRSTKEGAGFWSAKSRNQEIRAAQDVHWAASDANDFETEHRIYHEGAVPEYPRLGEANPRALL
jgi:hypothetical protein